MKTKQQKKQIVGEAEKLLDENKNVLFVDFSGISDNDLKELRKSLRSANVQLKVIKKRLLRVAFQQKKADFNPEQFEAQVATVFSQKELPETASPIYKFFKAKEKKGFKILGAYDLADNKFFDSEFVKMAGQLPSREILLAQLAGMLLSPLRMFLYVLDQKAKKST